MYQEEIKSKSFEYNIYNSTKISSTQKEYKEKRSGERKKMEGKTKFDPELTLCTKVKSK